MNKKEQITAYALNEMTADERLAFEAWLKEHPEENSEIAEIKELAGLLQQGLSQEALPELNPSQRASIGKSKRSWLLWSPLAAAAIVALAISLQKSEHSIVFDGGVDETYVPPSVAGEVAYVDEEGNVSYKPLSQSIEGLEMVPWEEVPEELKQAHLADKRRARKRNPVQDPEPAPENKESVATPIVEDAALSGGKGDMNNESMTQSSTNQPISNRELPKNSNKAAIGNQVRGNKNMPASKQEPEIQIDESMSDVSDVPTTLDTTDVVASFDVKFESKLYSDEEKRFIGQGEVNTGKNVAGAIGLSRVFDKKTGSDGITQVEPSLAVPMTSEPEAINRDFIPRNTPSSVMLTEEKENDGDDLFVGLQNESYDVINPNPFFKTDTDPLSTFSIDVDKAAYANVRRFLEQGKMPPPSAVRIEELINYFDYAYAIPNRNQSFSAQIEVTSSPWHEGHRLARIGLKGYEVDNEQRPPCNLVFLLDVSGSMNNRHKLPLVKKAMSLLTKQLRADDSVAIVVYAGASGVVLDATMGSKRSAILESLDRLNAGGSTNGGAGIEAAYQLAKQAFVKGGINRVILATDGDFNVGTSDRGSLIQLIEAKAKEQVFLTVLGFGMGNLKDDTLEQLADHGNGFYAYIDSLEEAEKVMVRELTGTLMTIAKDVKIQIEFNPLEVASYRLVGYENRVLAHQDFNNDKKDAGDIGAGHSVTAIYELVPINIEHDVPATDKLKYQSQSTPSASAKSGELFTMKVRYKEPEQNSSQLLEFIAYDEGAKLENSDQETKFAIAVASFGLRLRGEINDQASSWEHILELAQEGLGPDPYGDRAGFISLVKRAQKLDKSR